MSLINKRRKRAVRESLAVGWRQLEPEKSGLAWWQQGLILLLVIFAIWLIWWLLYSPRFQVRQVEVEGLTRLDPEVVSQEASMEGNNIFRIKTDLVRSRLSDQKEIVGVVLVRVLPATVRLVVTERSPVLVWKTTDNWYLVDQGGIAFRQISNDDLSKLYGYLPHVLDVANVQINVDDPVVPRSFIDAFSKIHEAIPRIFPDQEDYYEVTETVYDLDAVLKNGKRIRFNILTNIAQQLASLEDLNNRRPDLIDHGYIDLRVERWAYIK